MQPNEAILFLNNIGVTLLERQQYQDSMDTFREALSVSQCCQNEVGSSRSMATRMSLPIDRSIEIMIETAESKLMKLSKIKQRFDMSTGSFALCPMSVIDFTFDDFLPSLLKYGSKINQIDIVLRMDHSFMTSRRNDDSNLYVALLLLNFGVACKRSSEVKGVKEDMWDEKTKHMLHRQSVRFFTLSNRMIADEINSLALLVKNRSIQSNLENVLTLLQALLVSMCTTCHISDTMLWHQSTNDKNNDEDENDNEYKERIDYSDLFEKSWILFRNLSFEYMKHPGTVTKKHAATA
jgi:hypothetical protein